MGEQQRHRIEERDVDAVVDEYLALQRGRRASSYARLPCGDGTILIHGNDQRDWYAATFVREPGETVAPLCVGTAEYVDSFVGSLRGRLITPRSDDRVHLPASVVVRGSLHLLTSVAGERLLGMLSLGSAVLLLGGLADRFCLIWYEGGRYRTVYRGPADGLKARDLDGLFADIGEDRPSPSSRRAIRDHHLRIVLGGGAPEGSDAGPSTSDVARAALARHYERAIAVAGPVRARSSKGKLLTGRRTRPGTSRLDRGRPGLKKLFDVLPRLGELGCGDLIGTRQQLLRQIKARVPEFDLSPQELSDALNLLLYSGSCLIRRSGYRWHLLLGDLMDADSAHHAEFCKQSKAMFLLEPPREAGADPVANTREHREPARAAGDTQLEQPRPNEPTMEAQDSGDPVDRISGEEPQGRDAPIERAGERAATDEAVAELKSPAPDDRVAQPQPTAGDPQTPATPDNTFGVAEVQRLLALHGAGGGLDGLSDLLGPEAKRQLAELDRQLTGALGSASNPAGTPGSASCEPSVAVPADRDHGRSPPHSPDHETTTKSPAIESDDK